MPAVIQGRSRGRPLFPGLRKQRQKAPLDQSVPSRPGLAGAPRGRANDAANQARAARSGGVAPRGGGRRQNGEACPGLNGDRWPGGGPSRGGRSEKAFRACEVTRKGKKERAGVQSASGGWPRAAAGRFGAPGALQPWCCLRVRSRLLPAARSPSGPLPGRSAHKGGRAKAEAPRRWSAGGPGERGSGGARRKRGRRQVLASGGDLSRGGGKPAGGGFPSESPGWLSPSGRALRVRQARRCLKGHAFQAWAAVNYHTPIHLTCT